jgi:hypothetical protein
LATLLTSAYAFFAAFALTYNVGDAHVFFLPGHLLMALCAGLAFRARRKPGTTQSNAAANLVTTCLAVTAIVYGGWRAWQTWPVADRHMDRRADVLVARLSLGVDDTSAVLLSQMDWQWENALLYSARYERRDVAWTRLASVRPHLPFFVDENHAIGRDVVLTAAAAADVLSAYGPRFPLVRDEQPPAPALTEIVAAIPPGSPFVLSLLTPRDQPLDTADVAGVLKMLKAPPAAFDPAARYQVWAGVAGETPVAYRLSARPFVERLTLLGEALTIRMDGWLPFDTFRRGGFGHVLRGREPVLTIERGVSLVWFDRDGSPRVAYAAGLYAPAPRYRIPAASGAQQLARRGLAPLLQGAMLETAAP